MREPLSDAVKYHLLTGGYPARGEFDTWLEVYLLTDSQKQALWFQHRDALLAEWVRAHPGQRPASWWAFDASEPRQVLRGALEPEPHFLARLGLLADAERARLDPGAFDPVLDPDDELAGLDALGYHDPEDEGDCS